MKIYKVTIAAPGFKIDEYSQFEMVRANNNEMAKSIVCKNLVVDPSWIAKIEQVEFVTAIPEQLTEVLSN